METKYYLKKAEVDSEIKDYIEKKLEKIEKYLNNDSVLASIEIEKEKKGLHRVEIQIKIPGKLYIGNEKAEIIEEAVNLACGELEKQIRRGQKKRRTLQKRAAISIKKKFSIDKIARF